MTREEFTAQFKVGDRVRRPAWEEGSFLEILYLGESFFFTRNGEKTENIWGYNGVWLPWKPPLGPLRKVKYKLWMEKHTGFIRLFPADEVMDRGHFLPATITSDGFIEIEEEGK